MKLFVLALLAAGVVAAPIEDSNGPVELIVNGVPDGQALELGDIVDIKLQEHSDGQVTATNLLHPLTAVGIAEAAAAAAIETPVALVLPEASKPEVVLPEPVVLPAPVAPEVVIPEAVVLPAPIAPEVVISEAVVLPAPVAPEVVIPEAVVLPAPVAPEVVIPEAVVLPAPEAPEVVIPEAVVLPAPVAPEVVIPEAVVLPAPVAPEVVIPEAVALPAPAVPEVAVEAIPTPAAQLPNGEVYNDGTVQVSVNSPGDGVVSTIQGWFNMVLNYISNGTVETSQQII